MPPDEPGVSLRDNVRCRLSVDRDPGEFERAAHAAVFSATIRGTEHALVRIKCVAHSVTGRPCYIGCETPHPRAAA
jgi:hypothetical protein